MLSAFIISRDGERLLPAAIANLRRFADEVIVIVDAVSRDDSAGVAGRLADRSEVWAVDGCPEHVRNAAAALCRGDWVLMADDDELWPPAWQAALPGLLGGASWEYAFPRRHLVRDGAAAGSAVQWINYPPWWPDYQVRLRRRVLWELRPWPGLPHAVPEAYARATAAEAFWHLKFLVQSPAQRRARMERWGELWNPATGDHYRRFALPEEYRWVTADLTEELPEELDMVLRAMGAADETLPAERAGTTQRREAA